MSFLLSLFFLTENSEAKASQHDILNEPGEVIHKK